VPRFPAAEAESFFLAAFSLFRGELRDFDCINIHCIGVTRFRGGGGERLIRVGWFDVSSSDFVSAIPLGLEMNGLLVPVADGGGDGVHGHDMSHERRGNPSGVISDENVLVVNGRHSYVVLEEGGVFGEGWGEFVSSSIFSWFLYHSLGGEPGDDIGFHVMVFKRSFEVGDENSEGSHSDGRAYEGVVSERSCPG